MRTGWSWCSLPAPAIRRLPPAPSTRPVSTAVTTTPVTHSSTCARTLPPGDELFCLVGADSLQTLRHWHRAADALMLAQWIVAARPGFKLDALEALLPDGVHAGKVPERGEGWLRVPLSSAAPDSRQGTLWLLPDLHYEISATELRTALADHSAGIPQRVIDPRVAEYAREHQLYHRA